MKKYELMTIYPCEDEKFNNGIETVRKVLTDFGAKIEKEESFGDRNLTYVINKMNRGRYVLIHIEANPAKIAEIDVQFKLNTNLLRYMFVAKEEK